MDSDLRLPRTRGIAEGLKVRVPWNDLANRARPNQAVLVKVNEITEEVDILGGVVRGLIGAMPRENYPCPLARRGVG